MILSLPQLFNVTLKYSIIKATIGSHQLTEPDRTKVVSYTVGPNSGFKVWNWNNNNTYIFFPQIYRPIQDGQSVDNC